MKAEVSTSLVPSRAEEKANDLNTGPDKSKIIVFDSKLPKAMGSANEDCVLVSFEVSSLYCCRIVAKGG